MSDSKSFKHISSLWAVAFTIVSYLYLSIQSSGIAPGPASCNLNQETHTNEVGDWLYRKMMIASFSRDPSPDVKVVVIASPPASLSVMNNTCEGRRFLTSLVMALNRENAKVIAIDKFYSDGSCTDEDANQPLRSVLNDSQAKIVVGQGTHQRAGTTNQDDCLVLTKPFDFRAGLPPLAPEDEKVHFGLTRLNQNTAKIPLRWYAFANDEQALSLKLEDLADQSFSGFALAAVQQMDSTITHHASLQALISKQKHPFGDFSDDIPTWSAMDILCSELGSNQIAAHKWGNCPTTPPKPFDFHKKLVVIGEASGSDLQSFPGKERYGFYLQAAYISALLKEAYVEPLSTWMDWFIVIVFCSALLIIEVLSLLGKLREEQMLIVQAVLFILLAATGYICFRYCHIFAPVSLLAFLNFLLVFLASIAKSILVNHTKRLSEVEP